MILFLALLAEKYSFNGETTILASDGFHQYVIFAENLRNIYMVQIASFILLPVDWA